MLITVVSNLGEAFFGQAIAISLSGATAQRKAFCPSKTVRCNTPWLNELFLCG
ncbi:hypothetical protein [Phormidesmis priestleyi]